MSKNLPSQQNNVDTVVSVNCEDLKSFFESWVCITKPLHQLPPKAQDVLIAFLMIRYELSKKIKDEFALNELAMNETAKAKVREMCNIKYTQLYGYIKQMVDNGVCSREQMPGFDNRYKYTLNHKIIPDINSNSKYYNIRFKLQLPDDL